ncbi:MAG: hypothetical protein WCJ81_05655 [bacterium]
MKTGNADQRAPLTTDAMHAMSGANAQKNHVILFGLVDQVYMLLM